MLSFSIQKAQIAIQKAQIAIQQPNFLILLFKDILRDFFIFKLEQIFFLKK